MLLVSNIFNNYIIIINEVNKKGAVYICLRNTVSERFVNAVMLTELSSLS